MGMRKFVKGSSVTGRVYKKWDTWSEGDYFVGKFSNTEIGEFKGKPTETHIFEVLESNVKLEDKSPLEGKNFAASGAGMLNKGLKRLKDAGKLKSGSLVYVTYNGKKYAPKPIDQNCHTFDVADVDMGTEVETEFNDADDL